MADKHILHMVTPLKHMSPFDVNMAVDAGFDAVLTYTTVTLEEVTGLVQDAMFSRPANGGVRRESAQNEEAAHAEGSRGRGVRRHRGGRLLGRGDRRARGRARDPRG